MVDGQRLLLDSLAWLDARCMRAASTRPELDAGDLFQEVAARFLEEVTAWFEGEETRLTDRARARAKLSYLIMNQVTEVDRARKKRRDLARQQDDDNADLGMDLLPGPSVDLDRALDGRRAATVTDGLTNPTYRLALRAVYREDLVEEPEFGEAERAFKRPVPQAWLLFERERADAERRREHWRQVVAEIMRCVGPLGESPAKALKTARDWLDRTVQRARATVFKALAAAEVRT